MRLGEATELFRLAGIEAPLHDARELFMKIGGMPLSALLSKNAECNDPKLISAVERRRKREPLQYIIGEVGFYRESYKVTPDCLIPRQDTELLVDFAVHNIPPGESFIDLCTGSGCIAVSTLKNTENTRALALDICDGAIALTKYNAEKNGVSERLDTVVADALGDPIRDKVFAVLSNPPYVTESEYSALEEELYFEPRLALVAKDEGLEFYKKITAAYKSRIKPNGFIAYEIGFAQADALREIAEREGMSCEIIKDYSENDRVAVLRRR